ncbi:MAG TPA: hypothetical protein VFU49_00640 [Ktedonobacteraceae bacterium]|nr:hypothetical protein [Ktedonobacteraceae bacterium]
MSIATRQPQLAQKRTMRRLWKTPYSKARWLWLISALALYMAIFGWYFYTLKTQQDPEPINDPLRLFGIIAFIMVFSTAAYSLRRRFVRGLPGKVQGWLWMHTWIGIATILVVFMHDNYGRITHDYCTNFACLTDTYWATAALFALIFLVVSGIIGRLLDLWQTHNIAREAGTNGVGIMRALEERVLELEYIVERLCAGKSEPLKQYCLVAIEDDASYRPSQHTAVLASIMPIERRDFQQAVETLTERLALVKSLKRQQRAQLIIRVWRSVHIVLACLALLVIAYHGIMELLANVLHVITPA